MRWDRLFDDLEAQLEAVNQADHAAEVADRTRREVARTRLADRFRTSTGRQVTCRVLGAGPVAGRVAAVGPEWVLIADPSGAEALLPAAAIVSVTGLGATSAVAGAEGRVAARLGLGHVLRGLARDRATVAVTLVDGSAFTGTVDRVGADFVEVAEHGLGEARRPHDVRGVRSVPFGGLGVLRRV
ncbi:MAG TPA: hypothetical protein VK894_00440 [Jiangellales bacterium]|nr:hypothetical protein [Jiangellales bacterium]